MFCAAPLLHRVDIARIIFQFVLRRDSMPQADEKDQGRGRRPLPKSSSDMRVFDTWPQGVHAGNVQKDFTGMNVSQRSYGGDSGVGARATDAKVMRPDCLPQPSLELFGRRFCHKSPMLLPREISHIRYLSFRTEIKDENRSLYPIVLGI